MASHARGSFAQRAAQAMHAQAPAVENWDDDADFHGDLFAHSVASSATGHTAFSFSSRANSARSESLTGDDDWHVLIAPNDESSTKHAISSAKQAGIPIPGDVPSSALLGGTIKRLGKKPSRQKVAADDDWGDDLEFPGPSSGGLKLKNLQPPMTPVQDVDDDDFDWAEGSLGIRFGGTRRDTRHRGSSVSATMSPSLGSCMTLESEDDDFGGLVLPKESLDFNAILRKRREAEDEKPPESERPPTEEEPAPPTKDDQWQEDPTEIPNDTPAPPAESIAEDYPQHQLQQQPGPKSDQSEPQVEVAPAPTPDPQPGQPPQEQVVRPDQHQPPPANLKPTAEDDDFFADIDFGSGDILDTNRHSLNRHLKVQRSRPPTTAVRAATTLTFTDKPTTPAPAASRIPRPLVSHSSRSKLAPVYETGTPPPPRHGRAAPTTTNSQLLRAKRSAPVLRSDYRSSKPFVPFLPAGASSTQSHNIIARTSESQLRRGSDPNRAQSPAPRAYSRTGRNPDTPSRSSNRKDIAPASLAREAATKRLFTKPARKRNFGDGTELELFDDLPTSVQKESKYIKQPSNRPSSKLLRQASQSKIPTADRPQTHTPAPAPVPASSTTLRSPSKRDITPSFARDTAASRMAREQRLAGMRSRGDGPLVPVTNWKARVAAQSPQAQKKRNSGQKPYLIKQMNAPSVRNENGMTYNPALQCWEGNESALAQFSSAVQEATQATYAARMQNMGHSHSQSQPQLPSHNHSNSMLSIPSLPTPTGTAPASTSPPRAPALISNISTARGVQVERGMVFDPRRMCWLKLDPHNTGPLSPTASIGDESDPFADIEDLKEDDDKVGVGAGGYFGVTSTTGAVASTPSFDEVGFVGEEFDLGPEFIRRQREEENVWKMRVAGWVGEGRDGLGDNWKWLVRDISVEMAAVVEGRRGSVG
ncbi:uncharacterized protein K452DRAFT_324048 [Aplosporella prunicola CBS 121167]|uniref:Cytokinesis regulator n=1 Tax=Aplosporella prunicola CBS 121167 TaxID=1176127 RepID=A0A6A6BT08_9PEZI|nr:uncharacterized protein K452DRAFT_324048 [Aplosporella prunicola CBS 121167]KAF2145967.1 hypothetical protein K452DRAFT_324048 [Aplosporella prunicola CBS 121167]